MKYEITKGSEKDFEGAPENALTVYRLKGSRRTHLSPYRPDEFALGVEIIAERRPIPDPVWSGEGLPPVGVECEMENDRGTWLSVDVIAHKDGFAFGWSYDYRMVLHSDKTEGFRPIRSPEDVAREKITLNMLQYMYSSDATDYAQVCKIHNAIAAGKIPGVKLE